MSSLKRSEAARINGGKSRGPTTPEGKATSSMNALRHGMCAKSLVLTNEDEEKFQAMRDGYMQHFQPEGEVELDLMEEVISSRWRQRRIWGIETALLDLQMDTQMKEIEDQFKHIDETTRTAIAYKSLADTSKSLTQTTRHEALFSRQYRLAMKTLIQIQKERKESNLQNEPKPPTEIKLVTPIDRVAERLPRDNEPQMDDGPSTSEPHEPVLR
jgi:hypothetical protein